MKNLLLLIAVILPTSVFAYPDRLADLGEAYNTIIFENDSDELPENKTNGMRMLVQHLTANRKDVVLVVGISHGVTGRSNKDLASIRADTIKAFLFTQGVRREQVATDLDYSDTKIEMLEEPYSRRADLILYKGIGRLRRTLCPVDCNEC